MLFLWSKKVCFLSRTLLNLISSPFYRKQIKRKLHFFYQKHGLTTFGKKDFSDFEKFGLYSQKDFFFQSRTLLNIISSLILTGKKKEKKVFFDQEHRLTSLEK